MSRTSLQSTLVNLLDRQLYKGLVLCVCENWSWVAGPTLLYNKTGARLLLLIRDGVF